MNGDFGAIIFFAIVLLVSWALSGKKKATTGQRQDLQEQLRRFREMQMQKGQQKPPAGTGQPYVGPGLLVPPEELHPLEYRAPTKRRVEVRPIETTQPAPTLAAQQAGKEPTTPTRPRRATLKSTLADRKLETKIGKPSTPKARKAVRPAGGRAVAETLEASAPAAVQGEVAETPGRYLDMWDMMRTRRGLRSAVVMAEILGPPVVKRSRASHGARRLF